MATRKLDHGQWESYFNRVDESVHGTEVHVEVSGLGLGDQVEADWITLNGLTYDRKDNLFEVTTDAVDHLIRRPAEIYVDDDVEGLHSVEIVDQDNNHQIITLRPRVPLSASH